jgi:hypothetical protein
VIVAPYGARSARPDGPCPLLSVPLSGPLSSGLPDPDRDRSKVRLVAWGRAQAPTSDGSSARVAIS